MLIIMGFLWRLCWNLKLVNMVNMPSGTTFIKPSREDHKTQFLHQNRYGLHTIYIINTLYTFFKPFHRLINQNKRYFVLVSFDLKGHRSTISPQFDSLKRHTQTFAQRFLSIRWKSFISTFIRRSFELFKDRAHSL